MVKVTGTNTLWFETKSDSVGRNNIHSQTISLGSEREKYETMLNLVTILW